MQAPCGIEIKVGQVWSRGTAYWDVQIKRFDEDGSVECWRTGLGGPFVTMKTISLLPKNLTNKRGGYKLVKEAQ